MSTTNVLCCQFTVTEGTLQHQLHVKVTALFWGSLYRKSVKNLSSVVAMEGVGIVVKVKKIVRGVHLYTWEPIRT